MRKIFPNLLGYSWKKCESPFVRTGLEEFGENLEMVFSQGSKVGPFITLKKDLALGIFLAKDFFFPLKGWPLFFKVRLRNQSF